jgi:hypothetical protein
LNILDTVFKILNEFRCIYLSVRNHCTLDYSIHVLKVCCVYGLRN